jgi:DNA-binding response OmpR family regulator
MEGYDVVSASDGQEAVETASAEAPDLCILDIMMPRMDGWTARQTMLENDATKNIPVIFLSAKAQMADVRKGLEAGVSEYVTKPFDPAELLDIVAAILDGTYEPRPLKEQG